MWTCGLDSDSSWKNYYPIAEIREHGEKYSAYQKAGKFIFDCTTVGFDGKRYDIYLWEIMMNIRPLTWYNGRGKGTEMQQIPLRNHTAIIEEGGWGTALSATRNICFCIESWWILNSCLLFQEHEYSSLTLVAQPNNCNHRTQLFAWCVFILCSFLKEKKKPELLLAACTSVTAGIWIICISIYMKPHSGT